MAESVPIGARLRNILADFLLALINATALLVIAAAILAIVAMARIDSFSEKVACWNNDGGGVVKAPIYRQGLYWTIFKT